MIDWQPTASMSMLQQRAQLLAAVRAFFAARQVLEVDVPMLSSATVTEPGVDSLCVNFSGHLARTGYLITSPEFSMKRLLAAGSGAIYYLGHVFRADESGSRHHAEFTMLEWYRPGWTAVTLMQEVRDLVTGFVTKPVSYLSYRQAFLNGTGLDPFLASTEALAQLAHAHCAPAFVTEERDIWLDLLFSHLVEPQLQGLVFVSEFPASQASLAQTTIDTYGNAVAARFELYIDGVEIANGYQEEQDAAALRQRFIANQQLREKRGQSVPAIDEKFMAAMTAGLPACAGVALGFDRLLMAIAGERQIRAVLPFME